MTDSVCGALGIDRIDMCGKMILIEEQHGSDANFVVNSVLSGVLEKGHGICLVLFHNTFGHYHNVGMKLGYNLNVMRERGQVVVTEPMKIMADNVEDLGHDSVDAACVDLDKPRETRCRTEEDDLPDLMKLDENLVRQLFVCLRNKCHEVMKSHESVVIIVDDLSHLFDLRLSLKDVWFYVRYLRSWMQVEPTLSVCIMTHTYKADPESCQPDMIVVGLKNMAHLMVTVEPLSTGHANDISGRMNVSWRVDSIRRKYHLAEKTSYLYKLHDRHVNIFAPGSAAALS
ncbi:elongator complex protein 6 [Venturia canescens]|uniref:elongator complex protein 6 n=1 Tax=Venturia canescens TaxID=32260 RepID=UPI001C9C6DC9|nr:elongator complex protein 6 [Venturia canescens]XP_043282990.1 elongator complex protein 6 [Venturia canescens]